VWRVFGLFITIVHFAVTVNAFVRSLRERFVFGTLGALVRGALMIIGTVVGIRLLLADSASPPAGPALVALITAVVGPIVSFAVLWVAHRRTRNVPAAQEERLGRPFNAWLPVALIDAAWVAIGLLARAISNPF
jgi:hypothetical protein